MGKEDLDGKVLGEVSGPTSLMETTLDALNRKNSFQRDRFEFERLISGFSSTIIGLPIEDLKFGLGTWLKKVAQFFGADRIAVSELGKDEHSWVLFQSYTDPALSIPPIHPVVDLKSFFPSVLHRMKKGEILVVNNALRDLPEPERQLPLIKDGTKSFLSMALAAKEEVVGIFTIGMFRHEKQWTEDHVRRLKLIGDIITNALMRRRAALNLAEETIQRKNFENQYTTILKTTNIGFWIIDLNHNIIEVNDAYCAMTGYDRQELLSLKVFDIDVDNSFELLDKNAKRIKQNQSIQLDSRHRCRDGSIINVNINGKVLENANGVVIYCFIRDISDLIKMMKKNSDALRALQDSEERFRSIFNGAMDGIILSDTSTRKIVMANRAMCQMLGYTTAEMKTLHIDDIHPSSALTKRVLPFLKKNREHDTFLQGFDIPVKKKDGTVFDADISNSLLRLKNNSFFIGVFRDVSERKAAEAEKDILQKQLLQSQKMEAVGMLAGGVAHDFNNMLSVVLGYTELQMLDNAHDNDAYRKLKAIHDASERSAGLVRQLLAFARKQTIEPKILDLNTCIAAILDMLRHLISEDIELSFIPGDNTGQIKIDPAQIDQIMANLVVNARDAIAGIGKIFIETKQVVIDEGNCIAHVGCIPGTYAQLTVSDNGCGMDQTTLDKIFEPFFSTKESGEGTGLGLATVYGIVKQNHGYIYVSSEMSNGTSFKLLFPSMENIKTDDFSAVHQGMSIPTGRETILIVEDDGIMLDLGKTLLEKLGYTVLCAGLPEQALELARSLQGNIDLLLTDVVMPQMNGKELAKRLSAIRPEMKCLFMSGYPSNVISNHGILEQGVSFIKKPFSLRHFAEKVRLVLNNAE